MDIMKKCQEITQDIEKGHMTKLSIKERLEIRVHSILCPPCRQYFKDSATIDNMLKRRFRHPEQYQFSLEEKENMKKNIRKV